MKYDSKALEAKMQKTITAYENNLADLRASQANAAILNRVTFEYYGSQTPIKDMAGIMGPQEAYDLVKALKEACDLPVVLHTHATTGLGPLTLIKAVEAGAMGFEVVHPSLGRAGQMDYFREYCEKRGLYKMGGADHSSVIGGYIPDDPIYDCPEDVIGIPEEDFMMIYERRLG